MIKKQESEDALRVSFSSWNLYNIAARNSQREPTADILSFLVQEINPSFQKSSFFSFSCESFPLLQVPKLIKDFKLLVAEKEKGILPIN
ncbi:hypothetical protein NC653_036953 [Populus alba x Populus x berolinensis]|uniref:Uncharacterized protein n=1 Tax=Populus alba x Populus x berolinensis TaxID=444605 RepID=A0AAD6PX23_9ROSI|nr:hypothetical protein NC653_036953 [Populus alba x Populus x berolinensis]